MHLNSIICALSVDSSLGKVDKHSLPQESLMELLIEGFTKNKEAICGRNDKPRDVSEWNGLTFNDAREIIGISWFNLSLYGTLLLQWLPLAVKKAFVDFNKLSGTVDLTCLPDSLVIISLSRNNFEGTIDLSQLPRGLEKLYLYENKFFGHTDFSHLPKSLTELHLKSTQLDGEIHAFDGKLVIGNSKVKDMRKK